jgi:hypothetical protein
MTKFEFIQETNPVTGYVRYWTEKDGVYVDHTISDREEQAYQRFISVASGIPLKPNIEIKETIFSSTE